MSQVCTVCTHDKRKEIDKLLVLRGKPIRSIAGQYGLSRTALHRHRQGCITANLAEWARRQEVAYGGQLVGQCASILEGLLKDLDDAAGYPAVRAKIRAGAPPLLALIGRARKELESNGGGVTIVNQVAVTTAEKAETLTDEQIADRCLAGVERWNAAHPERLKLPRVMQVEEVDETTVAKAGP